MKKICVLLCVLIIPFSFSGCDTELSNTKKELNASITSAQEHIDELDSFVYDLECVINELSESGIDTEELEGICTNLEESTGYISMYLEDAQMYYDNMIELEDKEYDN